MKFYFAYGSNMWKKQMGDRCPNNSYIGLGALHHYRWIISSRGYANIVASPEDLVYGSIYKISETDEMMLDKFEGVNSGSYYKESLDVDMDTKSIECLVYIDPITSGGLPRPDYINKINNGIRDANLPDEYVRNHIRKFVPNGS